MRAIAVAALALLACSKVSEQPPTRERATPATATAASSAGAPAVTRLPAPARIVAIGDLHGDLAATRAALKLAGAIGEGDHWAGKDLMVVQTGDEIDRADDDRAIVELFDRLADEAKAAGGAVVALDGNHEVMNAQLDFRYVTDGAYDDFTRAFGAPQPDERIAGVPERARARAAAFMPGGAIAKRLAKRGAVAVVGDTVFLHGGLTPKYVRYGIDRMNREIEAWMAGGKGDPPSFATAEDGPLWSRRYSAAPDTEDCRVLAETLAMIPAKRMVVGHTVQRQGIGSACDDRVWRIDVGMSKAYDGKPEVLEIAGDRVRAIGK